MSMLGTTIGTSHFVSREAAILYYRPQFDNAAAEVDRKLADDEIHIGPPQIKPGDTLTRIDDGLRYGIVCGDAA